MSAGVVVALVVLAAVVLCALAWWSSGWSKRRAGGSVSDREVAKAMGTLEGQRHEPPGTNGAGIF